jgi:hypothetical protein
VTGQTVIVSLPSGFFECVSSWLGTSAARRRSIALLSSSKRAWRSSAVHRSSPALRRGDCAASYASKGIVQLKPTELPIEQHLFQSRNGLVASTRTGGKLFPVPPDLCDLSNRLCLFFWLSILNVFFVLIMPIVPFEPTAARQTVVVVSP